MTKTLRLLYPQWQGAHPTNIMHYLDDKFNEENSILGYNLGSQIVNLVVPPSNDPEDCIAEVPISNKYEEKRLVIVYISFISWSSFL